MNLFSQNRYSIRPIVDADRVFYTSLYGCPKMLRHIDLVLSQDDIERMFQKAVNQSREPETDYLILVIFDEEKQEKVGIVGLTNIDYPSKTTEIGIMLTRRYQGKNLPVWLLSLGIDYAFRQLKLDQIDSQFHPKNIPAKRIVEKLQFSINYDQHQPEKATASIHRDHFYSVIQDLSKSTVNI